METLDVAPNNQAPAMDRRRFLQYAVGTVPLTLLASSCPGLTRAMHAAALPHVAQPESLSQREIHAEWIGGY